ncbi:tail fiber domain-containing protein, partial [Candidatus Neomarinimicrobiota bacterium]
YNGTYVGIDAGKNNISGIGNTFSGYHAGLAATGSYNTFTGSLAGLATTTGTGNAFYGRRAGENNITGTNNTYIGYATGQYSTGNNNVFLGTSAGANEYGSNELYIENTGTTSPLIWGDFSGNRVVINGNSSHNTSDRTFFSNGAAGGTGAWNNDSDGRKKKNIATIDQALDKVQNLRGVNFEWKETEHHEEGLQMGFIAQEVEAVIPEVVSNGGDSYSMQYSPLTALLVEAVKEQQQIILDLKQRVQSLENQQQLAEVR